MLRQSLFTSTKCSGYEHDLKLHMNYKLTTEFDEVAC
jgi:hypothetical protein